MLFVKPQHTCVAIFVDARTISAILDTCSERMCEKNITLLLSNLTPFNARPTYTAAMSVLQAEGRWRRDLRMAQLC